MHTLSAHVPLSSERRNKEKKIGEREKKKEHRDAEGQLLPLTDAHIVGARLTKAAKLCAPFPCAQWQCLLVGFIRDEHLDGFGTDSSQ